MKTDAIEFDTMKNLRQIVSTLQSGKWAIEKLDDPFDNVGGSAPDIAVLISGRASVVDAFKHFGAGKSEWAVQVIVTDLGNTRHVEMIALGESGFAAARAGMNNQYFNIRHSKDHRNQIAQMLA
ncbi:MAG: hypothetical protein LBS10_05945 [Gracilibacteraceae bacterium]|jgi:hypothetical protein|nr:hypothetical protein [Gracilibacteraceae bacterium]